MKKSLTFALLTFITLSGYTQCINPFYTMEKGTYYETANYNRKDKLQSKQEHTVTEITPTDNGYQATISMKATDRKGETITEGDLTMICDGDVIKLDMQSMLNFMKELQNIEGAEIDIESDHILLPAVLEVGQVLPESNTTFNMSMGAGGPIGAATVNATIRDRTVAGQEDITTPAGTFSCYKITYNLSVNMKIMGMGRQTDYSGSEWIAEGVGMVRNEQYDKKGKLTSYSILTQAKK